MPADCGDYTASSSVFAGIPPLDINPFGRDFPRMGVDLLLQRIKDSLAAVGLSERKALLMCRERNPEVGLDFIRDMRRRGHDPKVGKLTVLAEVLQVPLTYLTDALGAEPDEGDRLPAVLERVSTTRVPVRGVLQAGLWQSDFESYDVDRVEYVDIGVDHRFPGVERSAFRVRGDSMDRLYPEGTIVIVATYGDLGMSPADGDKVVVIRDVDGNQEATIKQLEIRDGRTAALWPRSSNPQHSAAIILPDLKALLDFAGDYTHHEYQIAGRVIQSLRPE